MEQNLFSSLPVDAAILQAVEQMGFQQMTEVQSKAIPPMLTGRDVIAKAPTGTGKTCAFGIPLIQRVDTDSSDVQAIILAPTRELATQICDDLRQLTQFLPQLRTVVVYGGQSMEKQKQQLKKGAQILVATPGRLLDLMQHRSVVLSKVSMAVLDEADKMLDMGFYKDVRKILDSLKGLKQMCMFSATISREVMDIGWLYQRDPEEITVLPVQDSEPKIDQYSIQCIGREKIEIILRLMKQFEVSRAIVFCNTKYTTGMVAEQLHAQGLNTACLHGDMRQSERNKIMEQYKAGEIDILVATDVAARGIDVSDIQVVFNYDIPQENDAYLHRIGRTGRAKKEGISFVLHSKDEQKRLDNIIHYTRSHIIALEMDGWGVFAPKK
ncbi:MAG: DEAD/DEAH box helicase [Negativibacillus sp.]|nr:DEAD/DEAH box helicase [Negativibacillus sp.]